MLKHAGAALIRVYQRQLSPRKGYRCAYGVLHESGTCSSIGLSIMEQQGFWAFWRKMPLQFEACRVAAATLEDQTEEQKKKRRKRLQDEYKKRDYSGIQNCNGMENCDLPCDLVDFAMCDGIGDLGCSGCEIASCG
jgi:putative component of membrane protein insertase Oxa1/YidC/SpoIIIJ protein YidD